MTTEVKPGANLPSLIANARAYDEFLLDPEFTGSVVGLIIDKPVLIRSTMRYGQSRIIPSFIGATLIGDITVTASHVSLKGFHLVGSDPNATLLTCGENTSIDQIAILGSPQGQHRGICANSANVTIMRSYISNIWASIDAQAIAAWTGCEELNIYDCYLESSAENFGLGGTDTLTAQQIPNNVRMENCDLSKPVTWQGQAGITVKNLIELKNCRNVLIKGCRSKYNWQNGQDGYSLVLTVRNQSGTNPWATIENVSVEDCDFAHTGSGINILGSDDTYPSLQMNNIAIRRSKFTDINPMLWGGPGRQIMIGNGPQQLEISDCLFSGNQAGENSAITFTSAIPKNTALSNQMTGFVVRGCEFDEGQYGLIGDNAPSLGTAAIALYNTAGYTWYNNIIHKGTSGRTIAYPAGTILE
jgi:hypothetical protein